MLSRLSNLGVWVSIALVGVAHAHMGAFHPAMYCLNGPDPKHPNLNTNEPVKPLYNLTYDQYWMHHINGCDEVPPPDGVFLELPAGGSFTVEHAENQAFTSLTPYAKLTDWGDGKEHPRGYSIDNVGSDTVSDSGCLSSPNLHAQNESMAQGTAFAISYESDIKKVTLENLVVFTVKYHTPWKRIATYEVPAGMPECPPEGCICVIPYLCGQMNIYIFPYRCRVHSGCPVKTIGKPKAPVLCEKDPSKCVKGPKQIMIWHQLDGNNVVADGIDPYGKWETPRYNQVCGFEDGAQNDIFVDPGSPDAMYPLGNAQTNSTACGASISVAPTSSASATPVTSDTASGTLSATTSPASAPGTAAMTGPASGTPTVTYSDASGSLTATGVPTHPTSSRAPTSSQHTCKHKVRRSELGGHKRMARHEQQNIF
ncbi:hypothetical protein JVU11DRAFT_1150 [Chiua virens]|nr:hypothetical protein JVU11DRAFT_1150 [Chiua virens]